MRWLTDHFTKPRELHSWEMLTVRIWVWFLVAYLVVQAVVGVVLIVYIWFIFERFR